MTILIVTGMDDVHADLVIPKIEQRGHRVVRMNTDNFADNATFTVNGDDWGGDVQLRDSDRSFGMLDVESVWYRKPVPVRATCGLAFEQAREFANSEFEAFLRSLYALMSDAFWVSDYWRIRAASQKLANLRLANRLGLKTPPTLITNSESQARAFAARCNWKLLAKPFALTTFKTDSNAPTSWDSFATLVTRDMFETLCPSIKLAPTMLQQYIDKRIELRVTIVGRRVFCASIDSQAHSFAAQDWRAVDAEELKHDDYRLPEEVADKLLAINRAFGLQFSTHDLIVDNKGNYVWLEINPNGQWAWVEELAGLQISSAIADLLGTPLDHAL
jgi:hypothetical protein